MLYIKRRWDETRGDTHDDWGESWWYFEIFVDGSVVRQIEQYDSGEILTYSVHKPEDRHGALAEKPLDLQQLEYIEISKIDFETLWNASQPS